MALHQKLADNRWRAAGTLAAVAATTVGGGIAFAATGDNTTPAPSTAPSAPSESSSNGNQKAPDHDRGPRDGLFGALHGEFVVPKDGGGYQTVVTQSGSVTAVSSTSITVKSADGYSRTYVVNADTKVNRDGKIADIKTGETVRIRAVVSGSTATASSIDDGSNRPAGGPPNGAKPGSSESTPK
jgi:hypothetical protein